MRDALSKKEKKTNLLNYIRKPAEAETLSLVRPLFTVRYLYNWYFMGSNCSLFIIKLMHFSCCILWFRNHQELGALMVM